MKGPNNDTLQLSLYSDLLSSRSPELQPPPQIVRSLTAKILLMDVRP